jgi:hypothetical protein
VEKSRLVQLALALFVGLIFISSYVSLVNYNSQQSTTSTIPATYFAQGFANAVVSGYTSPMYFNVTCSDHATASIAGNEISRRLNLLEVNNSVFNFYSSGRNVSVEPGNMSAQQIYSSVTGSMNQSAANCTLAYSTDVISLPAAANFTVGAQNIAVIVPRTQANATIVLPISYGIGSHVRLKLSTLVTANATIYGPIEITVLSR